MRKILLLFILFGSVAPKVSHAQLYAQDAPYAAVDGEKIYLKTYGNTGAIQWQQSQDALTWNDIAGFTHNIESLIIQSNASNKIYFRAKEVDGNTVRYSKKILVDISSSINTMSYGTSYHGGWLAGRDVDGTTYVDFNNLNLYSTWGFNDTLTNVNSQTDGYGNTKKLAEMSSPNATNPAVYCNNLEVNGYDDWYLPVVDEFLNHINTTVGINQGVDYSPAYYWTSTEASATEAIVLRNVEGNNSSVLRKKSEQAYFTCIRKFKINSDSLKAFFVSPFDGTTYSQVFNYGTDTLRAKVCAGTRVEIRYTGPKDGQCWSKDGVWIAGTIYSDKTFIINSVSKSDNGLYTYEFIKDVNHPMAPFILEVVDLKADAGSDFNLCVNSSKTLNGSFDTIYSNNTFRWQPNNPVIDSTILNPAVHPLTTTNYYLTIQNTESGCVDYATVKVTPENDINITQQPGDMAKCENETIAGSLFSVSATGDNISYQWKKDGQDISNAKASAWTKASVSLADEGLYTCELSNTCRSITTDARNLKIVHLDVNVGSDRSFCNDNATTLSATASSNHPELGSLQYGWSSASISKGKPDTINGVPSTIGLSNPNILNPEARPMSDLYYFLRVTSPNGCSSVKYFRLNSISSPAFVKPVGDTVVCSATAVISPNVTGTSVAYQWYADNQTVSADKGGGLQLSGSISAIEAKNYRIEASNSCKTIVSPDFKIKVMQYVSTMPGTVNTCAGDNKQLDFSFTTNHPEIANYVYNWAPTTNLSAANIKNPVVTTTVSRSYNVSVTDKYGCSLSAPLNVNVPSVRNGEQICLVTVDPTLGKNKILLKKTPNIGADYYMIYKETGLDSYSQIGYVKASEASEYIDLFSNPESHGDKYKITILDTCGNESTKSFYHKTINLTIAAYNNTVGLSWNKYEDESGAFMPFRFYIFRGRKIDQMELIDSVSGSFTSYNDVNVSGLYYYMVAVKKADACNSNKSAAGTFSYSNFKANGVVTDISERDDNSEIRIFPNPIHQEAIITLPASSSPYNIRLIDITGKIVFEESHVNDEKYILNRNQLPAGVYTIEIMGSKVLHKRIIFE